LFRTFYEIVCSTMYLAENEADGNEAVGCILPA